uniref:AIG1-type G domain-containing protein n=1 Tax=Amphimedon queenslandica TaxID=400682 RepID=A0A1X7TZV3_AMPQE
MAEGENSIINVPGNENIPDDPIEGGDVDDPRVKELPKGRSVNILVIGPVGVGKSTLINAMFGKKVAKAAVSARAVTSVIHPYVLDREGATIKIYDTPGFGDTEGKSDRNILFEIAKHGQFDLILICNKLVESVNVRMLSELASVLHEDMWKRTVVVFTFANQYSTMENIKQSNDLESQMEMQINEHKARVVEFLSKSIKREVLEKIPFCIAGLKGEKKLPIVNDWLKLLWATSIDRSSDEARPFLTFYARNRSFIEAGSVLGSLGAGAGIGAAVGTFFVPGPGTAIGAAVGAGVGGAISLVGIGLGRIFK